MAYSVSMPVKGDKKFDEVEVLERAMNVFWRAGYEGVGTTELIREMGVGRQSVYDTYGTKRELFLAALKRYAETYGRMLTGELDKEGRCLERLERQFALWGEFALTHAEGCLIVNSLAELFPGDDDVTRVVAKHYAHVEDRLRVTLLEAKTRGEVPPTLDEGETARTLVAILNGLFLMGKLSISEKTVRDVLSSAKKLLK